MDNSTTCLGMDAHKNSVAMAMLVPGRSEPVEWTEPNMTEAVRRLTRQGERHG